LRIDPHGITIQTPDAEIGDNPSVICHHVHFGAVNIEGTDDQMVQSIVSSTWSVSYNDNGPIKHEEPIKEINPDNLDNGKSGNEGNTIIPETPPEDQQDSISEGGNEEAPLNNEEKT